MTTKYTDAPRTRVMTPAALNNGVHENHSIGQTMAIAPKKGLFDDISIPKSSPAPQLPPRASRLLPRSASLVQ